jgi:hypothetical protein
MVTVTNRRKPWIALILMAVLLAVGVDSCENWITQSRGSVRPGITTMALITAATGPVTASTSVSNHPDTTSGGPGTACKTSPGGPVWADDTYPSRLTAVQTAASTWRVTVSDSGSFLGFADPATCRAMLSSGSFQFLYSLTVTSASAPHPAGLHSSYTTQSTSQMVSDFFGGAASSIAGGDYFASYQGGDYVQTTSGSYGDVIAAPAPVLTLAFCGVHSWKVTQNKSLVATRFRYFSKVGTTYLLDGTATVASGSSVRVTERPRATGGLVVRYPSAGRIVTVTGSRTLTACGGSAAPAVLTAAFRPAWNGDLASCTCDCGNGAPNGGTFAMHVVSVCSGDYVWAYAVCAWYGSNGGLVTLDSEGNEVTSPGYSTASCGGGASFYEIIQWGKRWKHGVHGTIYTANWGYS